VPLLNNVLAIAEAGCITGASSRNWASYGAEVQLASHLEGAPKAILCDPQTSGGLLVACADDAAASVMETFARHGFGRAAVIGGITDGVPRVTVDI